MARNPQAIAKALIRANQPAANSVQGGFGLAGPVQPPGGMSPLVASYGDWTGGRALGRGLPRDPAAFLAGAFGPLVPMQPAPIDAPNPDTDRVDPRRWVYPVGWNMPHGQPGDEGLKLSSFATLRTIADAYSVARACIQLRKSELVGQGWDLTPTPAAEKAMRGDKSARKDFDERRAKALKFFKKPDSNYFAFKDWFSVVLEDVLVIDAPSIYLWPSRSKGKGVLGSDLGQLAYVDGATIKPLVDAHGATPQPPQPGYQQYAYGVPRVDLVAAQSGEDVAGMGDVFDRDYRADRLIYRPFTPRVWTPYGFAPIEQALVPVLSGLQRQQWQLDFFSEGSVPALFVTNGDTNSTPQQNRELQDALNAMAGDPAWKHKIIVIPGGSQTMPQRPADLAGQFDELVQMQVCMAFSVMPMELGITPRASSSGHSSGSQNQMGKLSENAQERKANRPMLEWFSDIFNHIIQNVCRQPDMQWWWEGLEEDEDEQTKTTIQKEKVSIGLMSIDEARIENGQQPWGLPTTADPVLITATGVIPFGSIDPSTGQPEGLTPKLTAAPLPPGVPGSPGQPPKDDENGSGTPAKPGGPNPTGPVGGGKPAPKPDTRQTPSPPAHAGAQRHAATAAAVATKPQPAGKPTPAQPAPKAEKTVHVHAALRELDLIRRRLAKGRGVDEWMPEHIPDDVFAPFAATVAAGEPDAALLGARTALKAVGHRQRRSEAIAGTEQGVIDGLRELAVGIGDGSVSTAGFVDQGVAAMRGAIRAGLTAGAEHALDAPTLGKADPAGLFGGRYGLYAGQVNQAYEQGYGLATLGAVDDPDNIVVRWHHRPGACPLCTARADEEFTVGTLPGWPGDGSFGELCEGGPACRCHLEYLTVTPEEAARAAANSPSGSDTDRALAARQATATDVAAARRALASPEPQPALAEVLNRIADRKAEQQRPYLMGLLKAILTAIGQATGRPVAVEMARPSHGDDWGWLSGAVLATVIAAAVAAAIAAQVQSQRQAAPATQPAQPPVAVAKGAKVDAGNEVYDYLAKHYPEDLLDWVRTARWSGPVKVPLGDVNMARRKGGARDPAKVKAIAEAIEEGKKLDPIVLVKTPEGLPYQVADGFHRTLALDHCGKKTVKAWIGEVDSSEGPWDKELHEAKLNKVDHGPAGDHRARHLHEYWTHGEGLARWIGSPHPWTALYHGLLEYIHDPDEAKRTASQWFHDATGMWSGERRGKNPAGPG